jgi:hypothetical protein
MRIVLFLLAGLLSGCAYRDSSVVLLTSNPELALYAEIYNSGRKAGWVETHFHPFPESQLNRANIKADIIISSSINNETALKELSSLNVIINKKNINPDLFYRGLLKAGKTGRYQKLLPLSFNLPMIVMDPSKISGLSVPDFSVDTAWLKEHSTYKPLNLNNHEFLFFSPFWNPDFLYYYAESTGADFQGRHNRLLDWNDAALRKAVKELKEWNSGLNSGKLGENEFKIKYMYEPYYKLFIKNRIGAYQVLSDEYFNLPHDIRKNTIFRLFSINGQLPAGENVLYAGVNKKSSSKLEAYSFLTWLADPEIQLMLLEETKKAGIKTFGFAGGFSSLRNVNHQGLALYNSSILGFIPQDGTLFTFKRKTEDWANIKEDIILPYLVLNGRTGDELTGLKSAINEYYRKKPVR